MPRSTPILPKTLEGHIAQARGVIARQELVLSLNGVRSEVRMGAERLIEDRLAFIEVCEGKKAERADAVQVRKVA